LHREDRERYKQYDEYFMAVEEMASILEMAIRPMDQAPRTRRWAVPRVTTDRGAAQAAHESGASAAASVLDTVDLNRRLPNEEHLRELIN
jgi:hypothetical protein